MCSNSLNTYNLSKLQNLTEIINNLLKKLSQHIMIDKKKNISHIPFKIKKLKHLLDN